MLWVTETPSVKKACAPTEDLESIYQFLASLPVLVSVMSLIKQIQFKMYDLGFGHFLVSWKVDLLIFVLFLVVLRWGKGVVERQHFFLFPGGQPDDISPIPVPVSMVL